MPNGFHSSGELNPGAATTLNSKRGQAFSSTAIEHHSGASGERRPEDAERLRSERKKRLASDGQTGCIQLVRDERIDRLFNLLAPCGCPPTDREQLVAQLGPGAHERRQQLEPNAIAKMVERAVRRVVHELDGVRRGVGIDIHSTEAEQRPHQTA
jgi:hypothetical protein